MFKKPRFLPALVKSRAGKNGFKNKFFFYCRTQNYVQQAKTQPREYHKSQFIFEYHYYAALLPRREPHIASHSVRLSVWAVIERHVAPPSELQ